MANLQIAALAYGVFALLYLAPTYVEGERAGGRWTAYRVAGLVACLFWPVLTLIFIRKALSGASGPEFVLVDDRAAARRNSARRPPD